MGDLKTLNSKFKLSVEQLQMRLQLSLQLWKVVGGKNLRFIQLSRLKREVLY